jgi:hypothetical protein
MGTHDRRDAMRQLPCTTALLVGLFAMLLLTTGGMVVTAQAARATKALTAARATACIQTAVAAQAGVVTKVEVEDKGGIGSARSASWTTVGKNINSKSIRTPIRWSRLSRL